MATFNSIRGAEPSTITFKAATVTQVRNSSAMHQELITLADPESSLNVSRVLGAVPASTSYGLVVRPLPPAAATASFANVASSATNVTLLAANAARLGVMIFNDSTAVLYVKLGATASATSYTVQVAALGYYSMDVMGIYTGIIDGLWASANGSARITELTA